TEVAAVYPLHRQVVHATDGADVERLDDVGVPECDGQLGLAREELHVLGGTRKLRKEPLDGHLRSRPGAVERPPPHHLGHPALAQGRENLVVAEPRAGRPEDDLGLLHRLRSSFLARLSSAVNRGSPRSGARSGSRLRSSEAANPRSIESLKLASASSIRPSL